MRIRLVLSTLAMAMSLLIPIPPSAFAVSTYPSAPLDVTQTAIAAGVRIGWTQPSDVATGITGYRIEKSSNGLTNWSLSGTVSNSVYTYDVVATPLTSVYVRVAATVSAGIGPYGYKWTKVYETTSMKNGASNQSFPYESGFGLSAGDVSQTIGAPSFTRVRYLVSTTISTVSQYADVDFYKWVTTPTTEARSGTPSPTISNLQIPIPYAGSSGFTVQANVQDLTFYSTNTNAGSGFAKVGRLEIWGWDYGATLSGLNPTGNNASFDFDDLPSTGGNYGSFQVHNATNAQTVFAWNMHSNGGTRAEFGYGSNGTGNPDWTFCNQGGGSGNCPTPSAFRLQIMINSPVTTLSGSTTSTISVPTSGVKRSAMTLSATSSLPGYFAFTWKGKKIAGCSKRATAASAPYTATCSWRPSLPGLQIIKATFTNASAGYTSSEASGTTYVSRRSGTRS